MNKYVHSILWWKEWREIENIWREICVIVNQFESKISWQQNYNDAFIIADLELKREWFIDSCLYFQLVHNMYQYWEVFQYVQTRTILMELFMWHKVHFDKSSSKKHIILSLNVWRIWRAVAITHVSAQHVSLSLLSLACTALSSWLRLFS